MSVFKTQSGIDLHWFFQFFIGDNNGSLFSANDKLAGGLWTIL